jgi:signal transduction histidine kinase
MTMERPEPRDFAPVGLAKTLLLLTFTAGIISSRPLCAGPTQLADPVKAGTNLTALVKVLQVRDLAPKEAARGYPVRVTGVITYWDTSEYKQFVQDDSAGVYVELSHIESDVSGQPGDRIEVLGFTGPGDYAPIIHAEKIRVLGRDQYPPANVVTIPMLMRGSEDSQWVSLKGIIRDEVVETNAVLLELSTGESNIHIIVPRSAKGAVMGRLVDAVVKVQGVCSTIFDERRRLKGVELHIPEWTLITVLESGPEEPFRLPVSSISELFQFHAGIGGLHRAHVQGSVLLSQTDGSFFIQDGTGGILVQPRGRLAMAKPGTMVEVVGFPGGNGKRAALQEALVKSMSAEHPIVPSVLGTESPLNQNFDSTLVSFEGRLIDQSIRTTEELLTVQFGREIVDATLERGHTQQSLPHLVVGSTVRLTGVYLAGVNQSRNIESFQMLLRSPGDVVLLSRPSWWTAQRTVGLLAGLTSVLLACLAWAGLLRKQVQARTKALTAEIDERKRAEDELKRTQGELLHSSRMAGMAEVATSVLHNVGNVLNSVNVSASVVSDAIQHSKMSNLSRAADLINLHAGDLGDFMARDPKGRQLPGYLTQLAAHLGREREGLLQELELLKKNVEHIKDIVATQQTYARVSGVSELVQPTELVEDALRMNSGALQRHDVQVIRRYDPQAPEINVDKQKVLQILVNLVQNAKHACEESGRQEKRLTIGVANGEQRLKISVSDNGVGIPAQNLTRIFNHGFTTRKHGHGFGLHSGALAARELGGALLVQSDGPGKGATFTLELPLK